MINTQTLKGNLINQDYSTAFTLNQGDKGVPFKVELLENGTPYTLQSTDIVTIEWLKPNGNPFLQEGNIKYGTNYIEFTTPESVAQYSGSGSFNIIISNSDVRKGTIRREYKVVPTSMKPGSVSEDTITDAITELRELSVEIADTVQNNQDLINNNQAATQNQVNSINTNINTINTNINNINSSLEDITNDINSLLFYPRLSEETDDYNRILRAINGTTEGGTLKIPIGTYDLNYNDIKLTKSIKIIGQGYINTTFENGGISVEASNCELSNLYVNCPTLDNAFQVNQASVSNILINNCKAVARDHCYLIESYNGTVQDVKVINCLSNNSVHGFISKAIGTNFVNCKANNHTGFAFAFISDNIPSVDQVANAISNTILNCEVYNCGTGFFSYCRDKWNSSCVPRVTNNSVDGLIISDTTNPFAVGEETVPDEYLSIYRIDFMIINNIKIINPKQTTWSISLRNCYRCIIDNSIIPYALEQKDTAVETLIGNVIVDLIGRPHTIPYNISSIKPLDTSLNTSFEILLDEVSTSKIKLTNLPKNGGVVTVFVRSTGSSYTYGGFDTTNLIINGENILTQFAFNHGQITQWFWSVGVKKWILIYASGDIDLT